MALYRGLVEAMLAKAMLEECLDMKVKIRRNTYSTPARALSMKQGLGRCKRMNIQLLFLQQADRDGLCEVLRVPTEKNPAGIMTKAVGAETLKRLGRSAGLYDDHKAQQRHVE